MAEPISILDVNLSNIPDLELAEDDTELRIRVRTHEVVPVKSANDPAVKQLSLRLEPIDEELVDDIYAYVPIPTAALETSDKKSFIKACTKLKAFCDCLGIDHSTGVNLSEINGSEGTIIVGIDQNLEGVDRNRVKRWITPA